jgi:hypothetical protein
LCFRDGLARQGAGANLAEYTLDHWAINIVFTNISSDERAEINMINEWYTNNTALLFKVLLIYTIGLRQLGLK